MNIPQTKGLKEDIVKNQNDKIQITQPQWFKKTWYWSFIRNNFLFRKEHWTKIKFRKKITKEQYDIEDAKGRLMVAQQRLMDNRKSLNDNISIIQLLKITAV